MRGIVAFDASKREGLRTTTSGHYTSYALRSNDQWELYDDCKEKVVIANQNSYPNMELIVFTV